jgi:prepilin-type N-terminal cleavage/methylation domain-containing protein
MERMKMMTAGNRVPNKRQKGFTLLEILIALVILAIGSINASSTSNRITVANMLAQQVMEEILARKTTDAVLTTAVGPPPQDYNNPGLSTGSSTTIIPGAGKFRAYFSTSPNVFINGAPLAGTTQIDVQVVYLSPEQVDPDPWSPSVTFTSYKLVQ